MIQTKFGCNCLVLSEEEIFEKIYDVRRMPSDGNSSPWPFGPGELKTVITIVTLDTRETTV